MFRNFQGFIENFTIVPKFNIQKLKIRDRERDNAPEMLAMNIFPNLLSMTQQPNSDKGSLTLVVYRSRTIRNTQPGGIL